MSGKRISEDLQRQILDLAKQGGTSASISRALNVRRGTVSGIVKRGRVVPLKPQAPVAAIEAALRAGETHPAIINRLGVTSWAVRQVVIRLGSSRPKSLRARDRQSSDATKTLAAEIERLRAAGWGRSRIVAHLGITASRFSHVFRWGRRHGVIALDAPVTRETAKQRALRLAEEKLRAGFTALTVAGITGLKQRWVNEIARRLGLPIEPTRPGPRSRSREWAAPVPKPRPVVKAETVEEYLARGGTITRCPTPWVGWTLTAPMTPPVEYHTTAPRHRYTGRRSKKFKPGALTGQAAE